MISAVLLPVTVDRTFSGGPDGSMDNKNRCTDSINLMY